jgi:hypothetical protein
MATILKKLLVLCGCSVAVIVVIVREFGNGALSSRALRISLAALAIAVGSTTVVMLKRSATKFTASRTGHGPLTDTGIREGLVRQIRKAKIRVVAMTALLLLGLGLPEIRSAPLWVLLVALAVNLLITGTSVQTIVRMKRSLSRMSQL